MRRILLDNCVDHRLARYLPGFEIRHARDLGWERLQNGQLVRAVALQFDFMITVDKNMRHQTPLTNLDLAVIVLDVHRNRLDRILPLVPELLEALGQAASGEYRVVGHA